MCEDTYSVLAPPVPYGEQTVATSLVSEEGFKSVRGKLTEGRYLTFESDGFALANPAFNPLNLVTASRTSATHHDIHQRWVIHIIEAGGEQFKISSAVNGKFMAELTSLVPGLEQAPIYTLHDMGNGSGYSIRLANGFYLAINHLGLIYESFAPVGFSVFSVTYNS